MSKNKSAAQRCYLGAKIFSLVKTDVDNNHKAKEKENRIEIKATMFMPKVITVNEAKSVLGAGGKTIIVINGGASEVRIPDNYRFIGETRKFNIDEDEAVSPSFFDEYEAAIGIANAHNEGELIRLTIISDDIKAQIKCLSDAIKANKDAVVIYKDEDED